MIKKSSFGWLFLIKLPSLTFSAFIFIIVQQVVNTTKGGISQCGLHVSGYVPYPTVKKAAINRPPRLNLCQRGLA
jgi:hypothetical protein